MILEIIRRLGVKGGVGFAYEYAGDAFERMSMDERMTICNMSIEGGARVGYVNPDQTTFDYLRGRPFAPQGEAFERAVGVVGVDGVRSRRVLRRRGEIDAAAIRPTVTWGINPGQSVGVDERLPARRRDRGRERSRSWASAPGSRSKGTQIDVAFVGSCTNARLSDLREAARDRPRPPRGAAREGAGRSGLAGASGRRRSAKGSTRCSSTPGSSGAAPAARCAWR